MNNEINFFLLIRVYDLKNNTRKVEKIVKKEIKSNC